MTGLLLRRAALLALAIAALSLAHAEPASRDGLWFPSAVTQTEADEYTRYELLTPESASFRIAYEV
ncbi:MAG TPA: hypothetical protein VGH61_08650, partial [Steroidobacteraceae bacterium]